MYLREFEEQDWQSLLFTSFLIVLTRSVSITTQDLLDQLKNQTSSRESTNDTLHQSSAPSTHSSALQDTEEPWSAKPALEASSETTCRHLYVSNLELKRTGRTADAYQQRDPSLRSQGEQEEVQ
jgi:hypothetical protein